MSWDTVAPGLDAYFADEGEIRGSFWHPASGEIAIDVGCAEGSYTIPALVNGARVIAVDPSAERLNRLDLCASLARLVDPGLLTIINKALYDGTPYPDHLYGEDLAPAPDATFSTLDEVCADLARVDWVKIDTEGSELGVLRGGLKTLKRFHPRLLVEDHTPAFKHMQDGKSAKAMDALLRGLDYEIVCKPCSGPTSGLRVMWMCV